jgi:hypothetical protein
MKKLYHYGLLLIILILFMINIGKSKQTNILEEKIHNHQDYIEEIKLTTSYKHVDSLYIEIMDLGHKLDSMMLKYDYE